jgi:hypothetical protein
VGEVAFTNGIIFAIIHIIMDNREDPHGDDEADPMEDALDFFAKAEKADAQIRELIGFKEPDGKGKLLFSHLCNTEEFAASIFKCIDDVFRRHSLRSYKNKWCWEFPLHQHKELKKLLKDSN